MMIAEIGYTKEDDKNGEVKVTKWITYEHLEHIDTGINMPQYIYEQFKKISDYLRRDGVLNNDFFIRSKIEEANNIDPYSPKLSKEDIDIVISESKINFWYFLRRIIPYAVNSIMDDAFRINLPMIKAGYSLTRRWNVMLEGERQSGKNAIIIYYLLWLALRNELSVSIMGRFIPDSASIVKNNMRSITKNLPHYLVETSEILKDNFKSIYKEGNIRLSTYSRDKKILRAMSHRALQNYDECNCLVNHAEWLWINDVAFVGSRKQVNSLEKIMKDITNDNTRGIILSTTPADISTMVGSDIYAIRNSIRPFNNNNIFDMHDDLVEELVTSTSNKWKSMYWYNIINISFSGKEMLRTAESRIDMIKILSSIGADANTILREVFGVWDTRNMSIGAIGMRNVGRSLGGKYIYDK